MVAMEGVLLRIVVPPLVQGEGRIGDDDVELHELVVLDQAGVAQGVAPLDAEVVHAMQEHVHAAEGMGGAVHLLAEEGEVALIGLTAHLDQERAGTAGGIADGVALLGSQQLRQQAGDLAGGVELARFFACIGSEALQEVLIHVANDVLLTHDRGPEIQALIREVLKQEFQLGVAVLCLAELAFGIEAHLPEHAFELGLVRLFDVRQRNVNALADVGFIALGVEAEEVAALRKLKPLAGQTTRHALLIALVLFQVGVAMVAPHIGDVLPEQHHQDVVAVVLGIDDAPEGVAGAPGDVVDFRLVDFGHGKGS